MMRFLRAFGSLLTLVVLAALPVLAQEGEASPVDSPIGWVFRWLNFAIVFGAIAYLAWKKGGPYFRAHAEEISRKIEEGARAREAAERQRHSLHVWRFPAGALGDQQGRPQVTGEVPFGTGVTYSLRSPFQILH